MNPPRYCPLKLINSGLIPGTSADAAFHNRQRECRPDCALYLHEGCAIRNLAGAVWGILQVLDRLTTGEVTDTEADAMTGNAEEASQ